MRILKSILKLGLGGGAVYVVADQGLFSDSQKSTIDSMKNLLKYSPELPERFKEQLPSMSSIDIVSYWNCGVKKSIETLASLPADVADLTASGVEYIKEEIKKQTSIPDKK